MDNLRSIMSVSSQSVKIINQLGLHARAAGKLMNTAMQFKAAITVEKDTQVACGDSVMELLLLTASKGDVVTIKATGPEANAALSAVINLIENGFGENLTES